MNKLQALHNFWASFGWNAYEASSVPDNANLPYITHEVSTSDFNNPVPLTVTLWDRSTSWAKITEKEMDIYAIIGRGGVVVPYDDGALWITRGLPWSVRLPAEDDSVRKVMINYVVEYFD